MDSDVQQAHTLASNTPTSSGDSREKIEQHTGTTQNEEFLVAFSGDHDRTDPLNWPRWYKWICIALLSACNTMTNLAVVICLPAAPEILQEFHTHSDLFVPLLGSIWELGEAVGPLLTGPLSEIYGRAPVYNVSNAIFVIFSIACAVSSNSGMIIGFRFINGMGDAALALNASIAGDLFKQEERGLPIAILNFPPLLGPVLGPIVGGYLAQYAGWRWVFWFNAISGAVCGLPFFLFFHETYRPCLLRKRVGKMRKETGDSRWHSEHEFRAEDTISVLKFALIRPMKVCFSSPVAAILTLQISFTYGYGYIVMTTLSLVFKEQYNLSEGSVGLSFLGFSIGIVISVIVCALSLDRLLKWHRAKTGSTSPEIRLLPMVVGCAVLPPGLLLYGWTAQYKVNPVVPMVGTAAVGAGFFLTLIPMQAYFVDVFGYYAASAIAATVVVRCFIATFLPLAGPPLYSRLGFGWGNSLLGFIALLFIPVPIFVMRFGERLRRHEAR